MSDLAKRLRIKAGMIEMGERIAWGSDSALMREAADALGRIPDAGEKVGRPQIREAFMRNGARIEPGHDDLPDWVYESVFELLEMDAPAVQGEPVAVADALRQIAGWMDDGGPTYHEAELIGMAISGPVECSSAKQCTKAAKKAFLEAARIWEYMHQSQPAEQQPAPDVAGLVEALEKIDAQPHFDYPVREDFIRTLHQRYEYMLRLASDALAAHRKGGE